MDGGGMSLGQQFGIIVLVIVVAGILVAGGYSMHRVVDAPLFTEKSFQHKSPEQMQYMAEVRARNLDELYASMGRQNQRY